LGQAVRVHLTDMKLRRNVESSVLTISREKNRDCSGCPDFVDRVKRFRAYCFREGDQTCGSPIDGKIDDSAALVLKSPGSVPHGRRKRNSVFREKLGIS